MLLLETLLAFPDTGALLRDVARILEPGGRFAFNVEAGRPLRPRERGRMPDADTVSLTPWARCFRADEAGMVRQIRRQATAELLAARELWTEWLGSGRVRECAVVVEKR